jgi:hypothetical protein
MASTAHTTGADAQAEELRRRNVAGQSQASAPVTTQAQEKEKSKDKVRHLIQVASELSKLWWLQGLVANPNHSLSTSSPSSTSTSSSGRLLYLPSSPSLRACTRSVFRQSSPGMKPSKSINSKTYMTSSDLVQLWKVRFTLPQARVLLRCPSSARKDARRFVWIPCRIQWLV